MSSGRPIPKTVGFLLRGSRQPHIQAVVREIKVLEKRLNIILVPVWTLRSHERIVIADIGSKFSVDTDEWLVARPPLQLVFAQIGLFPTVDCFATQHNTLCRKFFSKFFDSKSAGINFFVQQLVPGECYFCCPPVALIIPCFKKLLSVQSIRFVLIVPAWHSAGYWPVLFPQDSGSNFGLCCLSFRAPFFLAINATSNVFTHRPNFDLLALYRI